jgi:branched-chain amino acid transport system substrate-binding protein
MFKQAGIDYQLLPIPPGTADMTPQLQRLVTDGTGLVHVMGTEAFCISAFNGLRAVFQAATTGITGDITPATILAKIKSMPEMELPGEVGLRFRCNGKATTLMASVCARGGVSATLDTKCRPVSYETLGVTPIESGAGAPWHPNRRPDPPPARKPIPSLGPCLDTCGSS